MSGISDAEEKKRKQERDDIINSQMLINQAATEASMARSQEQQTWARVNQQRRVAAEDAASIAEQAEAEAAAEQAALDAEHEANMRTEAIGAAMQGKLGEQYNEAQLGAFYDNPDTRKTIWGELAKRAMGPSESEKIRWAQEARLRADEERSRKAEEDVQGILQNEASLALRAALSRGDTHGVNNAVAELIGAGFEPEAVETVKEMFETGKKQRQETQGFTPEEKAQITFRGTNNAQAVIQDPEVGGDPGKVLQAISDHESLLQAEGAYMDPEQREYINATLKELRRYYTSQTKN
jgi:hypothetical protein